MALTGGLFLTLLAVALVVATGAAIFYKPRWGPILARTAQRAFLVVLAQALAILVAAVAVNNWGSFYGSWNDLFGGGTTLTTATAAGGASWNAATPKKGSAKNPKAGRPTGLSPTSWSTPNQYATKGQVGSVEIKGVKSKLNADALVYLPPQYFQPKYANANFPVVEVFTGYPGYVKQLIRNIRYPDALLTAMGKGTAKPMIMVFFNPALVPPRDTECTNVPHGPQVATYFMQDVPAMIEANLRTTTSGWGLMGHSTGGYCATKMAMMAPKMFNTVVSLSGNYQATRDYNTGSLWGGSQSLRNLNDPEWRLRHLPIPPIAVLASVGSLERGSDGLTDTRRFIGLVRPPMQSQLIVVQGGAHNFADYRRVLPQAFAWLSAHLSPSTATPAA
ncbi:MAG: alpha/beta hydrolase-fold protein [Allobranchiibius sp.]